MFRSLLPLVMVIALLTSARETRSIELPKARFPFYQVTSGNRQLQVDPDGMESNGASDYPFISADGRFVVFTSEADNLVDGDTNDFCDINDDSVYDDNCTDVFVHDRSTGQTEIVSVASDGTLGNGNSWNGSISSDGRYVVYSSIASCTSSEHLGQNLRLAKRVFPTYA